MTTRNPYRNQPPGIRAAVAVTAMWAATATTAAAALHQIL